jgi:hypothetical protein
MGTPWTLGEEDTGCSFPAHVRDRRPTAPHDCVFTLWTRALGKAL